MLNCLLIGTWEKVVRQIEPTNQGESDIFWGGYPYHIRLFFNITKKKKKKKRNETGEAAKSND